MYQRLIFYIGMLFQHVNVLAEIQKTVLLLLIVHAEMHKIHPKINRPRHWKPNAWPIDSGRDEATRTPDPYVPNVVRYQLRYIPMPKRMPMTNRNIAYATGFLRLNAVQRYCKNLNNVQMKRK